MKTEPRELREAREDAERYQRDLEDMRRRDRQRDEERERQRKEDRRRRDPSNRLYNGDIGDFREAVQAHTACLRREIVPCSPDHVGEMRELDERCNESMRNGIKDAELAERIYCDTLRAATAQAVKNLRDAKLDLFADCLEDGDYSRLAV